MTVSRKIEFARVEDLSLDPTNPRLGRLNTGQDVPQNRVLDLMKGWSLEELAVSFLENGYWPQEALVVIRENLYGQPGLVVVEGNRRLAALKLLKRAIQGNPINRRWSELAKSGREPESLFDQVPYLLVDSRQELISFLGFRHVTGIKEWAPAEKAEYISRLVLQEQMEFREVTRRIGSRLDAVRRNYVAYQILRQMELLTDEISLERVEDRFSILFLSLREQAIRDFLGVNLQASATDNVTPVPDKKKDDLVAFTRWLFGDEKSSPLVADSRQIRDFAQILGSDEALAYLKDAENPSFEIARRKAGADLDELIAHVQAATDQVELALSTAYLHADSKPLLGFVERLVKSVHALVQSFPPLAESASATPTDSQGPSGAAST